MKEMVMYLDPYANQIFNARQRRLREPSVHCRQSAQGDGRHAAWRVVAAVRQAIGAVLHWAADLPWDSRERLRSKEQELAILGITWTSDPVHDAALAREVTGARRRREANALASGSSATGGQDSSRATMTAVDVMIIDQASSGGSKRRLVTRLTDLPRSLDRDHQSGGRTHWRVSAQAIRSEIVPKCETDRRIASLNYAAWHAHVAELRRWVPVRGRR